MIPPPPSKTPGGTKLLCVELRFIVCQKTTPGYEQQVCELGNILR